MKELPKNGTQAIAQKLLGDPIGIDVVKAVYLPDNPSLLALIAEYERRTARELCGDRCFAFAEDVGKKQRMAATRAFGNRISDIDNLRSAVATHASTVAEKLRRQHSLATVMVVFAHSSPFAASPFQRGQAVIQLPYPTDDTRDLVHQATNAVEQIYQPGVAYAKAGVILHHLIDADHHTKDLFKPEGRSHSKAVMRAMDAINAQHGRHTVQVAQAHRVAKWKMRQQFLTPRYTTQWDALPIYY